MTIPRWAPDDELTSARLNELIDAIESGSFINNSATEWALTVQNTNTSGRSLTVLDKDGLDFFTILRASNGVDAVGIGLQDAETYLTGVSRLLVAQTGTVSGVMADFQFNANGGADSGAFRAIWNQ